MLVYNKKKSTIVPVIKETIYFIDKVVTKL